MSFLNLFVVLVIHGSVFLTVFFFAAGFFASFGVFSAVSPFFSAASFAAARSAALAARASRILRRFSVSSGGRPSLTSSTKPQPSRRHTSVTSLESRSVWRNSEESQFGHLVLSGLSQVMNWHAGYLSQE